MKKGLILQPTWRLRNGRPVVLLFGRLEDGPAFVVEDDRVRPAFYVATSDVEAVAHEPGADVEIRDGLTDLAGRPVARVRLGRPADVAPLRDRLRARGIEPLESDLRFAYHYLIDRGLLSGIEIEGEGTFRDGLVHFPNPVLRPAEVRPRLAVLSLDIETSPAADRVLAVALVGAGADEVHLVSARAVTGAIVHPTEAALLAGIVAAIQRIDPDVVVGWNVVDFDLDVLVRRCRACAVEPSFGRLPGPPRIERDRGFNLRSRAEVTGRVVLDGLPLVREALKLPDYRLETVARAVLGRGKLLDPEAPDTAAEVLRLFHDEPEALVAYNREDAQLVLDILAREGLLELTVERSLLSGMPLDRVGASVASFDRLYLPELHRRRIVAPSVRERAGGPVAGGAVLDSVPGFFRDVAVFDFKSLYPSLMRTFQLDPLAHARPGENPVVAPNGARFAREGAILPGVIETLLARREAAKARGDGHADRAIKIMMNALFGVLASPGCRFADPLIANAITGFGQRILHWTRDACERAGVRVIYGDTDSIFVTLPSAAAGDPKATAEDLRARVEAEISTRIRAEYALEPRLVLELEYVLERFWMPRVRSGRGGSKKRYAGWREGRLLLVGLESVRRDWPAVARRLQEGMLERVFTDREVMPWLGELVAQVRSGELDAELVYARRLRKGDLGRYTRTTPPHVAAARKLPGSPPAVVRYVITASGPEPVVAGRPLPAGIDREHALERVLRPVADAILAELGESFDRAAGRLRQMSLF